MKVTLQLNVLILMLLALAFTGFAQTTLYVNSSVVGGNSDGSSWANAYTSLQSALDSANSGDEIWAAKGTYNPSSANGLTNTSRFYHFRMKNGVAIYGGFAGTETAVTQRTGFGVGKANETILSGDIGTIDDNSDNCYHVFYHPSGIDTTAILDGFTVTRGNANGSSPHNSGGGMYNSSSSPTINNVTFKSNAATVGGGLSISGTSSDPTITNSLFVLNTSSAQGGGLYFNQGQATITNSTVTLNHSNIGGGMILINNAQPTFNNCIIWGNTAGSSGNQIRANNGTVTLNYSCYADGVNDVTFLSNGSLTATNNDITSDPQFVDADNGDYRILGISPAADAGDNSYNSQTYDIRGNGFTRKLDKTDGSAGTIDMGAYEYQLSNDPLPVELVSFTAAVKNETVELNWQTATEVNNYGFEIERSKVKNQNSKFDWEKIGFIEGYGNSNSPKEYSFVDTSPQTSEVSENRVGIHPYGRGFSSKLIYRLKQIDTDGSFEYSNEIEIEIGSAPMEFNLAQNYPNPFNPETMIEFTLPENGTASLKIFNTLGEEVATLFNELVEAGKYHQVGFNASTLASGIYIARLQFSGKQMMKKMLYLK